MATYKPFYIQKLTDGAPVKDSTEWGIWIKKVPFKVLLDAKDIPSRKWFDQHGDDEYVPSTIFYEAYEIDCEFVYKGVYESANAQIKSFMSYLSNGGMFKFYDRYTKIGRTNVRYVKGDEDPEVFYRREGNDDIVSFKVTLKVNDPVTDITLTK